MPNTLNPMQMQMMGYMNAPPDIQAGASEIFRQQQLADLLRKQAIEPIKADEYSKTGSGQWAAPPQIVPVGMGQGLTKLGEGLLAGYADKKASEDNLALANKLREAKKAHYSELFGSEAVPGQTTAPIGGQEAGALYTDDYTAVPATDQQGYKTLDTPATPGLQGKDLARALAQSWMPEFEKAGLHMMTNPPKEEGFSLKPEEIRYDGKGNIIARGAEKTRYENSSNLNRLLTERADLVAANPADPQIKAYDNAIRKESETARQITPVIKIPSQGHILQTDDGVMSVKDGVATPVLNAQGEPIAGKGGTLNLAGGRESVQIGRVIQASNQAAKDLENVARLPITSSSGIFGGRSQGPSLFEAGKEALANTMTTQDVQTYNAMAAGMQRNLAAIESAGLMPPGSLTKQMDAVIFKEGDTQLTKMHKLAQTRQIIEAAKESMDANPRISPEQKAHMDVVLRRVSKAVPYTHGDLLELTAAQQKNPKASMKSIIAARNKSDTASVGAAPAGWSKEEWAVLTPEEKASIGK